MPQIKMEATYDHEGEGIGGVLDLKVSGEGNLDDLIAAIVIAIGRDRAEEFRQELPEGIRGAMDEACDCGKDCIQSELAEVMSVALLQLVLGRITGSSSQDMGGVVADAISDLLGGAGE